MDLMQLSQEEKFNTIAKYALRMLMVSRDFEKMLNNKKFSDVTIVVEKSELYAHKVILSARSSVFSAMFEHDMLENSRNQVTIPDVKYKVFLELLTFIYTGQVSNIELDLLLAADKYALEDLKSLCGEELMKSLTINNAIDTWLIADRLNVKNLKESAIKFILANAAQVFQKEPFKSSFENFLQSVTGRQRNA